MIETIRVLVLSAVGVGLIACSSSSPSGNGSSTSATGSSSESGGHSGSGSSGASSNHTSGESGESGADTVSAYCTSLQSAEASLFSKCYGGSTTQWQAAFSAESPCTELASAVSAGRITFDASQSAGCLQAYAQVTCNTMSAPAPSACSAALSGTVTDSGTCYSTADCVAGSYCSGLGGTTGSCSGICKALVAAGQSCAGGGECVAGYACEASGSALTCTSIPTATFATQGAACGYSETTKVTTPCGGGLACNAVTNVCVPRIALSAACTPGAGVCDAFAYCDPTSKTCKADPSAGGKCGVIVKEDPIVCTDQSYCKPSSSTSTAGTCVALGATNAACTIDTECASGSCSSVDGGTGACRAACTEE